MIVVLTIVAPLSMRRPPPSKAVLPWIRLSRTTGTVPGMLNMPPPPSDLLPTNSTRSSVMPLLLWMPPPRLISWLVPAVASPPVTVRSLISVSTSTPVSNTRSTPPPSMIVRPAPAPRKAMPALRSRSPLAASMSTMLPACGNGAIVRT